LVLSKLTSGSANLSILGSDALCELVAVVLCHQGRCPMPLTNRKRERDPITRTPCTKVKVK